MSTRRLASHPAITVAVLAALVAAIDLGRRILATNDEARFALLAQDMLSRGAWLFPQLNDIGYHSKPLLQAWLIALSSVPVGHVTQFTAVLPSALAGVGTVLLVYAIGRAMFGPEAGRFAALAALTTQGWFLHARLPMPDMLLTCAISASLAAFWRVVARRPGPNWTAFYALVGLAFWTKGAAGLIPLVAAVVYAIVTRRRGRWRDLHLPTGIALVAALVAPWWIMQELSSGEAVRAVVTDDYTSWYVPRSVTLALLSGPLQNIVGILFPWVLVGPVVIWQAARRLRRDGPERDAVEVLLVWSAVALGCVAISEQQRLRYYLPLLPPAALLVGWWVATAATREAGRASIPWRMYALAAGALALATAVAFRIRPSWIHVSERTLPNSVLEIAVMAVGLVLMIGALAYGLRRDALPRAFHVAWLGSALWVVGWYHWELERRNAAYDYPRVQAEATRLLPEAPVVAAWGVYELPFTFYFDRKIVSVATDEALRQAMARRPRSSAVLTRAALAQVADRDQLRVWPLERLNADPIVLVTYFPHAPPAPARP
jgi:4-amino-4-deoxy-L-arabinose transferase-like glycosyltransferase